MNDWTHGYAPVGDIVIHYVDAGPRDGQPIVLLHGYPQTWYCWAEVIPLLIEQGFRCIAPDLRGLGDSTRAKTGYDKKTLAKDVVGLMTQHLGIERFVVAGHDWGGTVAFAVAAFHPQLVTHLAVIDVAIPGDGQAHLGQGGRRWHHTFLQTADLPEALISGREEIWVRWFYETYGHHQRVIDETSVQEYLRTYTTPGAIRTGLGLYRAIAQDIADNEQLSPISTPALAVGGGTSWGRGREVEESLRRMARNVTAHVFDECGHWVPEEQPALLAGTLIDFIHTTPTD